MAVLPNPAGAGAAVPSGPSQTRLITLIDGVAAQVDFAFTSEHAARVAEGSGSTFLGLFDASAGLDFRGGGKALITLAGRGAFFVERNLGRGYRLTGSIDTRAIRVTSWGSTATRSPSSPRPVTPHRSRVAPSTRSVERFPRRGGRRSSAAPTPCSTPPTS